jgi:hypothetical protein
MEVGVQVEKESDHAAAWCSGLPITVAAAFGKGQAWGNASCAHPLCFDDVARSGG